MEGNIDSSTPALVHSLATKKYLGKRKNKNTAKNDKQALRTWFKSMFDADMLDNRPVDIDESEYIWNKMVEKVIIGYDGASELTETQLQNLNVSLGHLVSAYRKKGGGRVSDATMSGYIDAINRFLREEKEISIDIRRDRIFVHSKNGYMTAFDNICKMQQAAGVHRKPYNVILDAEMDKMLNHELTNPATARGYVTRTIIVVGMLLGLRPTGLRLLSWSNFDERLDYDGKLAFLYTGTVGGMFLHIFLFRMLNLHMELIRIR